MAWPKGKPRPKKNKLEIVGVVEPVEIINESPDVDHEVNAPVQNVDGVAIQDTWRYHDTLEPRVFKAGEVIPDGWTEDHSKWRRNQMGQWEKAA